MPPSPGTPTRPSDIRISRDALRGGFLRSSLPSRTQAGFVAATLAVFLIAFLSYRSFKQRAEGARLVAHTLDVTAHLEVLLSTLQDAETGQRGFLLTGDDHYLEPYDRAVGTLGSVLPQLRALIADNPQELDRFDALERSGHNKMAELQQTIDLRHAGRTFTHIAAAVQSEKLRQGALANLQQAFPDTAFDLMNGTAILVRLLQKRFQFSELLVEVLALENIRVVCHAHRGPPRV